MKNKFFVAVTISLIIVMICANSYLKKTRVTVLSKVDEFKNLTSDDITEIIIINDITGENAIIHDEVLIKEICSFFNSLEIKESKEIKNEEKENGIKYQLTIVFHNKDRFNFSYCTIEYKIITNKAIYTPIEKIGEKIETWLLNNKSN
ncbi:hypothetical protein [Vallitalea maricola]|uniref:Uncharacterized protein n=1 Tax=Vallitalea maricola TaxID=3074433 RepID=A0ACB5URH8_9FIRM|nr:hypothetical protein AN2V17_44200 [Vallitalea sp. AN17-2]